MRPGFGIKIHALFRLLLGLLFLVGIAAFLSVRVSPVLAAPQPLTEGWTQVVKGGFTDPNNSLLGSSVTFRDFLYISTYAFPWGSGYSGSNKAGGDIWRTADGITWEQVGKAGLGDPDNMMFGLVVYRDSLYAISASSSGKGLQIFATSDGTEFARIEVGGLSNKNNAHATGFVFADRLILGVSNISEGAEIWVSDDGASFRQVVSGGMGNKTATGFTVSARNGTPDAILQGKLYIGVSDPGAGGEIWRTGDGLEWERVADKGLGRSASVIIYPEIVYRGRLYAFGGTGGQLDKISGVDLFRTSDGTTWEKVVDDGFGAGAERNVIGGLTEFKGRLYLTTSSLDPRTLVPGNPSERHPPHGFQLRVSDDGSTWTQVGTDGFGSESGILAGMDPQGDAAYLTVFDYREGSQLWRSTDGQDWELVFREPEPNFFAQGSGALAFKGHFLWFSNDLMNGVAIWRSDQAMVPEPAATTPSTTPSTTPGFVSSVPLPTQISKDPGVIGTNLVLALAFAAIFGFTCSMFNSTLQAKHAEIARALGRVRVAVPAPHLFRRLTSRVSPVSRRRLAPIALVFIAGLIYALLDPGFGFSAYGLTLFVSIALSVAVVTYSYQGVQALTSSRRYRSPAAVKLFPVAIGIAIACVLVSRLTGFRPGYIYGFVGGLAFLGAQQLDGRRKGRLVLLASGCLFAVSLIAWFLAVPISSAVGSGSSWLKVIQGICVGTFVAGIEGLFFGLIPLSITDGGTLFRWNKVAWAGAFGVAALLFWHVLLNKGSKYGDAFAQSSVKVMLVMLAFWSLATVGIYWYFRKPRGRAAAQLEAGVTAKGVTVVNGVAGWPRAFCSECGERLTPEVKYCRGCGARL